MVYILDTGELDYLDTDSAELSIICIRTATAGVPLPLSSG
jgi:hypothetical protein